MKRQKAHKNMLAALKLGDRIITQGGLVGTISKIDETELMVALNDDVTVKMVRSMVLGLHETSNKKN